MKYQIVAFLADGYSAVMNGVLGGIELMSEGISPKIFFVGEPVPAAVKPAVNSGVDSDPNLCGTQSPSVLSGKGSTPALSKREGEVLKLIADGMAAKGVAFTLSISSRTVDFHLCNIKNKLGVRSRAELSRYAVAHGL